jgi:hypothetical protein
MNVLGWVNQEELNDWNMHHVWKNEKGTQNFS